MFMVSWMMSGDISRFAGLEKILLLIVLITRVEIVASQSKVKSFTGENVLLPCVYTDELQGNQSVFWKWKDERVLDIKKGRPDLSKMAAQFRGRVDSFPELYTKGNFSIVINRVTVNDGGTYECHVPSLDFQRTVTLSVTDKPKAVFEGKEVSLFLTPAGGAADTHTSLCLTLLCLLWAGV